MEFHLTNGYIGKGLKTGNPVGTLPTRLLMLMHGNTLYHTCMYNRPSEDEPSGSKHIEDIKIKN